MLTVRCDTSCYITGYHTPHEAGEFSGNSSFCHIGFFIAFENHSVVLPPQTFVGLIGIGNDFWCVSCLSGLKRFGFESDLSATVALCCFDQ